MYIVVAGGHLRAQYWLGFGVGGEVGWNIPFKRPYAQTSGDFSVPAQLRVGRDLGTRFRFLVGGVHRVRNYTETSQYASGMGELEGVDSDISLSEVTWLFGGAIRVSNVEKPEWRILVNLAYTRPYTGSLSRGATLYEPEIYSTIDMPNQLGASLGLRRAFHLKEVAWMFGEFNLSWTRTIGDTYVPYYTQLSVMDMASTRIAAALLIGVEIGPRNVVDVPEQQG